MKTKRLELRPLNDRELGMLLNRQTEPELIKAYGEMLLGCRSKPDARLWYTAWAATLPDGTEVGDICFKGPPNEKRRNGDRLRHRECIPRKRIRHRGGARNVRMGLFNAGGAILSVPRPRMATAHPSACLKNAVFAASASAGRATFGRSNVPRRQRYPHFSASAW